MKDHHLTLSFTYEETEKSIPLVGLLFYAFGLLCSYWAINRENHNFMYWANSNHLRIFKFLLSGKEIKVGKNTGSLSSSLFQRSIVTSRVSSALCLLRDIMLFLDDSVVFKSNFKIFDWTVYFCRIDRS